MVRGMSRMNLLDPITTHLPERRVGRILARVLVKTLNAQCKSLHLGGIVHIRWRHEMGSRTNAAR